MPSSLNDWDWTSCRAAVRERASRLKRDPRVLVRFDESDLTQETLVKAIRAVRSGKCPDDLANHEKRLGWLATIQDNELINMLRREFAKKRDVRREQAMQSLRKALRESTIDGQEVPVDPSPPPEKRAEQRELAQLTDDAVGELDSPQREIVTMQTQGLTFDEIAKALGMTLNAVAGHYYRAIKKLRSDLEES